MAAMRAGKRQVDWLDHHTLNHSRNHGVNIIKTVVEHVKTAFYIVVL